MNSIFLNRFFSVLFLFKKNEFAPGRICLNHGNSVLFAASQFPGLRASSRELNRRAKSPQAFLGEVSTAQVQT